MNETASLAEVLASSLPDLAEEDRGEDKGSIKYQVTMPRLFNDDPDKSRKVAWASEHVRYSYVDQGLKYDSEAMAATFDINPGLCPDYDAEFRDECQKPHVSRETLMESAHVPSEVVGAVSRMGEAPAPVKDYADELRGPHPKSAVLVGNPTATVYAAWLVGCVTGGAFCEFSELVADIDTAEGRLGDTGAQSVANGLRDVSLLVLDEFDVKPLDSRLVSLLYPTVRHRHVNGLPTVITSSVGLEVVKRRTLNYARSDEDRDAARRLFSEIVSSLGRTDAERSKHTITCGSIGGR